MEQRNKRVVVIGAGMDKAGLINKLVHPVIQLAGKSPNRLVIFISAFVSIVSSFLQNIGAAALILPAIQRISRQQLIIGFVDRPM